MHSFREMDIEPRTAQEILDCETPNGMRIRLRRYGFGSAFVQQVFMAAEARGLSGEDTMTWLAFEALRRLEKLEDMEFKRVMREPMPPFILIDSKNA